ncbi:hypothetical protein [Pseudoalteromonas atlantica]|uniref:hypothetical protein n=1 Tax=Pseudoalteromonas atlantica TaxID=288 RepID=UPI003735B81C
MITRANLRVYGLVLLSLVVLTSSVNRHARLGHWLALQDSNATLSGYYQFPDFFEQNLKTLPKPSIENLALNGSEYAKFIWAIKLLKEGNADRAKLYWQAAVAKQSVQHRLNLAKLLLELNRWDELSELTEQGLVPESAILEQIKLHFSYPPESISSAYAHQAGFLLSLQELSAENRCEYNVLMMSDHRAGIIKLKRFSNAHALTPEPSVNSFCFSEPVYIGDNIACQTNPLKAATCNWRSLIKKYVWPKNYDFIVMMPREGRGNVRAGIMQLNSQSSYQLFLHELMHFSGFEDEYPVPKNKQAWLCKQKGYVAPNLFVANNVKPPAGWQPSETCEGTVKSYKPDKKWSIMRYQQLSLSAKYRELWIEQIENNHYKPVRYHDYFTMLSQSLVMSDKRVAD